MQIYKFPTVKNIPTYTDIDMVYGLISVSLCDF